MPRTPNREVLSKMGALSVGSPSPTPAPRTQSCPSPTTVTKLPKQDARSRDAKSSLPGDQTPTSSHRSSPFSSKTSSPHSFKRKSEVQPKPSVVGELLSLNYVIHAVATIDLEGFENCNLFAIQ